MWSDDDGGESLIGHKIWLMQVLEYDILENFKFAKLIRIKALGFVRI